MPEKSGFFDSTGTDVRSYPARDFADYFAQILTSGVFNGGQYLRVTANGTDSTLSLSPGYAWIKGYVYSVYAAALPLIVQPAGAVGRIDRVILRLDTSLEKRTISARVIQGTPSSNPVPPSLVRSGDIYDLSLAQIRVNANTTVITQANVTDERLNASVCGLVNSLVQVDTTAFQQQFDDFMASIADQGFATPEFVNNRVLTGGYGSSTFSGGVYSVNVNPVPSALVAGLKVTVRINTSSAGASQLKVNGLDSKYILRANGSHLGVNTLRANAVYTFVYNGSNFILQGEGGSGNALPSDVVQGKTFTNDNGEAVGTRVSYIAGDNMTYAKMGLTDMVPKTNILTPNTSVNTTVPMGLTQAKDGSGYYIVYTELTNVRLAKYDNFGKLIWRVAGVGTSNTPSSVGIPITGTRDGGVCLYFYNTQWSDPSIVKYTSDGSLVRRYAYTTGSYTPMDIQIDSDGAIFVTSSGGGVARLSIDDSFSGSSATDTWKFSQMSVNTDIVIYRDWIYFIAGSQNGPYFIRLTKGPGAPTTSQYSISLWSDEVLSGVGLVGNGVGSFYVSSTAGRIYCFAWTMGVSWYTHASIGWPLLITDIFFYNNEIYYFNKLNGLTSENASSTNDPSRLNSIKKLSYSGAIQSGEFPVLIKHATLPQLDSRLASGKLMQFTSDPPNNVILCLNTTTTLYANQMQIQP